MRRVAEHPILHVLGVFVALVALLPLVYLVVRGVDLGVGELIEIVSSKRTIAAIVRSLAMAFGIAALCVGMSLPLAWLTHATDLPGRRAFRVLLNLPLAVPSFVAAFCVVAVFGPSGWLRDALAPLGVEHLPEVYGWRGTALALLFIYPLSLVPVQASLAQVDASQWEAARSLGASRWHTFWRIVFPRLRGSLLAGGLIVTLYVLSDFGAVSLLRFESLSYLIYLRYKTPFLRDEAVAYGLVLMVLAVACMVAYQWANRRAVDATAARANRRAWPTVELGAWRWPAFGLCALIVLYGVGLPILVLGVWLIRGMSAGNELQGFAAELGATAGVGVAAGAICVAVALIPALLMRHGTPTASRFVKAATHTGYAVPGIVAALSLVFFATRYAMFAYQTLPLLLFAYVVRFLPLSVGAAGEGVERQSPRLFEAARSLGAGPTLAWIRVTLPASAPMLWAGFLVVFLAVIKELPATLLLSPIGFDTLATRTWSLTQEAFFTRAALPVFALLVLAVGVLWLRPDSRLRSDRSR